MEPTDIDQIIKECPDEWKGSSIEVSDSEEETTKDKGKGKEKAGENLDKERVGEKHKAPQEEQPEQKKMKTKSHRNSSNVHLGSNDFKFIANQVQEILDAPMIVIVTAQTTMKSALDLHITELNTIMERESQLTTQTPSTSGSLQGSSTLQRLTRVIQIFPTSIKLAPSIEVEHAGFIEFDLARIPIESLKMVQPQVHE